MGKKNFGQTQKHLQLDTNTHKKTPRRFIVRRSQERVPLVVNTDKLGGATVLSTDAGVPKN